MLDKIIVKGARQHNLKNIDVEIPRNKLVVITGLSGSGKSTLAFDTIYAEGQRRYVESLSPYARQFLGMMEKPDVDSIEGLSPAISIEQKTTSKNPRSTVGTTTEIYDYLRLLYARIGSMHCPKCDSQIKPQSKENITNIIMLNKDEDIIILSPIIKGQKGTHEKIFEDLIKDGFTRVRVNGKIYKLEDVKENVKLERYEKHWIEVIIDRVIINEGNRSRIAEAVENGLAKGNGTIIVIDAKKDSSVKSQGIKRENETIYSNFGSCPNHPEVVFEELEPRLFSFNSPFGACSQCLGLGVNLEFSEDLIIKDKNKSIIDGAISVYGKMDLSWRSQQIATVGKKFGFDIFTPINKFTDEQLNILLYGTKEKIEGVWSNGANMNMENGFEGIINQTKRLYSQTESESRKLDLEKFMISKTCDACMGKRLNEKALSVKIDNKSIMQVCDLSIKKAKEFFSNLDERLSEKDRYISKQVLKEINDRIEFLNNVGLSYLSLSRSAQTLSGGEAQRIRLASQIGSNLMGVLYVLDEPSIGLHQKDNEKLINTFHKLRDLGNTILVVEHDEDTIRASDYVIDMGPLAGINGGHIIAQGTPYEIENNPNSITGKYLSKRERIEYSSIRRKSYEYIEIYGASENNLKSIDVKLPTKVLLAVTGASGSGKSTLMNMTLMPYLQKYFKQNVDKIGKHEKIIIPKDINGCIIIDQEPIGRTPRSNPATYTKIFDEIRKVFAQAKISKERGYTEGRFSFNVPQGRCDTCKGDGLIKIEMNFLPDVYVECDTCKGKRYNKETLDVLYKGHNISDILDMSVTEALEIFENNSSIKRKLQTLIDVGLGYIKLGQSATTLSGGESQRIKLTKELAKFKSGHTIYLLDEPTTGLHFEDTKKLISVLNRLVDKGNSVFVIEHNLDVVKCCDYVIDIGPDGGESGGKIVATGTPEDIANCKDSYTGRFLKKIL